MHVKRVLATWGSEIVSVRDERYMSDATDTVAANEVPRSFVHDLERDLFATACRRTDNHTAAAFVCENGMIWIASFSDSVARFIHFGDAWLQDTSANGGTPSRVPRNVYGAERVAPILVKSLETGETLNVEAMDGLARCYLPHPDKDCGDGEARYFFDYRKGKWKSDEWVESYKRERDLCALIAEQARRADNLERRAEKAEMELAQLRRYHSGGGGSAWLDV